MFKNKIEINLIVKSLKILLKKFNYSKAAGLQSET